MTASRNGETAFLVTTGGFRQTSPVGEEGSVIATRGEKDLAETVARMDARFEMTQSATGILAGYRRVSEGFAADLHDKRDVRLSQGGALMLIEEMLAKPQSD